MKKSYFSIFLLAFLFFEPAYQQVGKKPNNLFTSDILFFEKEKKVVTLITSKTHFFKPKSKKYKFKKDRYFEIVPPEYQLRKDTLITYDSTLNKEINYMYKLVQEWVLLDKGGWEWEVNKDFSKKAKCLKFQKEKNNYTTVNKVVLSGPFNYRLDTKEDLENHKKRFQKTKAIIEDGRINKVITRKECIKDGYLREIQFKDLLKQNSSDSKIIKFKKGSWTLLKPSV